MGWGGAVVGEEGVALEGDVSDGGSDSVLVLINYIKFLKFFFITSKEHV